MPVTLTVPTLVMPSLLELPLSVARAKAGAAGALVSTVMAVALLDGVTVVLLAASVWRSWMEPAA